MTVSKHAAAIAAAVGLLGACTPPAPAEVARPEGETDLSCAAVIYAATGEVAESKRLTGPMTTNIGVMTRYATAYAQSEGIADSQEALAKVKLAALRLTGAIPGGKVSDEGIVSRAKACGAE